MEWKFFKDYQKTLLLVLVFLGFVTFSVGLMYTTQRTWMAYLVGYYMITSMSLGSLLFVGLLVMGRAGWGVNIRRFFEAMASVNYFLAPFGLILLFGASYLYPWLDSNLVASDHYLQHKSPYLNQTFFTIRMLFYSVVWILFTYKILSYSKLQNKRALTEKETLLSIRWCVIYFIVYALTFSFFSVDLLMSLQPHWYSTIFGVYTFSGSMQGLFSVALLMVFWSKFERRADFITKDHIHDLAKFLFGWTIFWAYIAFSQYMLIWYANLPEETFFFIDRTKGPWLWVSLSLIIFKFIIPFLALLPRWAKRSSLHLTIFSCIILFMQFVDIYWLVYPHLSIQAPVFGFLEFFIFVGFLALFIYITRYFLLKNSLRIDYDPFLSESDHHHVVF